MRGFYVVKNSLVKHSLSINERFSTIEGSTVEGFQCIVYIGLILDLKIIVFAALCAVVLMFLFKCVN